MKKIYQWKILTRTYNTQKFAFQTAPESTFWSYQMSVSGSLPLYLAEQECKIKQRLKLSIIIKRKKRVYIPQWLWVESKTICQKRKKNFHYPLLNSNKTVTSPMVPKEKKQISQCYKTVHSHDRHKMTYRISYC